SDEAGPAGLMAGADAGAIVAMKIFVKKNEVLPVRIALKEFQPSCHWAPPVLSPQENMGEPPGNFGGHLPEVAFGGGMRGALHFEVFAVVVMIFLERLDQEIVDRKPDWPAPVRISAEEAGRGFRRFVADAVHISVHVNFVGMILVKTRKGAHAVR